MLPPFHPEALEYIQTARSVIAYRSVPNIEEPTHDLLAEWAKIEGCNPTITLRNKKRTK